MGPADLKNKSKDSAFEAFYLKGREEKRSGSWWGGEGTWSGGIKSCMSVDGKDPAESGN